MAKQTVDIGRTANDGTGDPLRTAFTKVNQNFDEVYSSYSMTGRLTSGNSTVNTSIANTAGLRTGNSTWNATVNSSSIRVSNFANTAILSGSSLTVGANVVANLSAFFVGNSTVNAYFTTTGFVNGNTVVNSTAIAVGSAVGINTSAVAIGNSTSNIVFSQTGLTGNVLINGSLTVNGTMTSVNTSTLDVADINITIAKNAANASVANGAGITIAGAQATINYYSASNNFLVSHPINIGNSSVNGSITVTNYSGTANNANNLGGIAAANFVANTSGALTQNSSGHFIVANTGTVVNSAGLFVNAAYIATLTANNANNLGGVAAASYVQNTDSRTLSGNLVISGTYFNPSSNSVLLGNTDQRWVISANSGDFSGNVVAAGFATGAALVVGNSTVNTITNSTMFSGTANNANNLGGFAAANYVQNTDSRTLSGNLAFSGANVTFSSGFSVGANVNVSTSRIFIGNATVNATVNSTFYSGIANNATYAFGKAEAALNVNNALTSNDSVYAYGKTEGALNVNSALTSNNSVYAFSKTEGNLNVNNAVTSNTANNSLYLGGTLASGYQTTAGLSANVATLTSNNSLYLGGTLASGYQTTAGLSANVATLTSNNSLFLGGTAAAAFVQNSYSGTLSGNVTFSGANVQFSGAAYGSFRPRVSSATSITSPLAWNSDNFDTYIATAQATALTINADSGSPVNGQKMMFRIKDNGTSQSLTWTTGSAKSFRAVGITLPTSTSAGKLLYVGAVYNSNDQRWDVIGVAFEA